MKNLILLTAILLFALSCKKVKQEPLGPTDVRIRNLTTVIMTDLTVNTFDSTYNYGILNASTVTDYHQFNRAYSTANISAIINGIKYKTDTAIYTGNHYMGQMKITYEVYIEDDAHRKLQLTVIPESALK